MNELGLKYVKYAEKLLSQSPNRKDFVFNDWISSPFQERLMRFGQEFKAFELEAGDTANISKAIRASLIFSFLKVSDEQINKELNARS